MRYRRRTPWAEAVLAVMVVVLSGSLALAQDEEDCPERISAETMASESLTPAQQRLIAEYTSCWSEKILEGEDAEVARARLQLREPLGQTGSTVAFNELYNDAVTQRLAEAVAHERLIVRLNAMIVVTRLSRDGALPLVAKGLTDENAAVRYWAAKAVRNLAGNTAVTSPQRLELLGHLTGLLQREDNEAVVEQVMLSIVELEIPQAQRELLNALNGRVSFHMQNPGQPLRAERSAMNRLFQRLIAQVQNNAAAEAAIRQLAQVALRYHDFAALQLDGGELDERRQDDYRQMVQLTDQILRFIHDGRGQQSAPASIENAIRVGDWAFVRVQAEQWRTILSRAPFNFSRDDLSLERAPAQ